MIEVYHFNAQKAFAVDRDLASDLMTGFTPNFIETVERAWNHPSAIYQLVAEIESDDLEFAWRHTNNLDDSWSMEPHHQVTVKAPLHVCHGKTYGLRSSMVGDVFEKDGEFHVVAVFGFTKLAITQ